MDNYQATIDRLRRVRRWLIPVMSDDPIPGRDRRYGLAREDWELVVAGCACPKCRACWQDEVLMTCPACLHERSPQDFLDGVKEWQDYLAYVQHEEDNPERTQTTPMHEAVERISRAHGVKPTYDRGLQRR